MEKKVLPVSAENKGFEEDETFGTASVKVEQQKPMNIDERLMCRLFPIRLFCLCTHLLRLSDNQRWDAATCLNDRLLIGSLQVLVLVRASVALMPDSVLILRGHLICTNGGESDFII